jgi:hypothetical protein
MANMKSKRPQFIFVKLIIAFQFFTLLAIVSLHGGPHRNRADSLQTNVEPLLPTVSAMQPAVAEAAAGAQYAYSHRRWGQRCPVIPYKININTEQVGKGNGSAEDFRRAIIAAADTWSAVEGANFTLVYGGATDATTIGFNGENEIVFLDRGLDQPSGLARYWFTDENVIMEADIWINDAYNWDATGAPDADEVDLQSVALHEFGHWLALAHDADPDAVMNATIEMGSLKRRLHRNELAGIRAIYPRRPDSPCPPGPKPVPNAEPTWPRIHTPRAVYLPLIYK